MRRVRHAISAVLMSSAIALLLTACGSGGGAPTTGASPATTPATTSSTATGAGTSTASSARVSTALVALYRVETLALATYRNAVRTLGTVGPFPNILEAERRHAATVAKLASEHGVTLPAPAAGEASPGTLRLACALGVRIEQQDIATYDRYLPYVSAYPAMHRALQTLQTAAKERHLPAFQRCS